MNYATHRQNSSVNIFMKNRVVAIFKKTKFSLSKKYIDTKQSKKRNIYPCWLKHPGGRYPRGLNVHQQRYQPGGKKVKNKKIPSSQIKGTFIHTG